MICHGHSLLLAGCYMLLSITGTSASIHTASDSFDWDSISPSPDLEYHDCYETFKCARLEVPLNWLNETDERKAIIAMMKLPAEVPDDDPTFGGSIFTNPGGPGHSGVEFLEIIGPHLRYLVDKPGHRHYEVISFDPRGVGRSTPSSDCFHNDVARNVFTFEARASGALTNGDAVVAYRLAMIEAYGKRCEQSGDAMSFVGTPSVARDMVEMVDKVEELRRRQGQDESGDKTSNMRQELKRRSAQLGNEPGDLPRLQYVGFSYGTILGNYFASMFPGRVGRMVLDGVCNTDDYATGAGWLTNTLDADETFDKFIEGCAQAGPEVCALARDTDASASDLRTRFDSYVAKLDKKPLSVLTPSGDAVIVTGEDVRAMTGLVLYNPILLFKTLAAVLDQLFDGDGDDFASMLIEEELMPIVQDTCSLAENESPPRSFVAEGQHAVLCGDGDDISGQDVTWWSKYIAQQSEISSIFGGLWSTIRFPCAGWRIKANWQFKGPFTSPEPDAELKTGQPAAPIFFVTNRLDPVTPLRAAQDMAAQHPGARVLVQEALGHCALVSAPSKCTKDIVADYFETGVIPTDTISCPADCGPWDEGCSPFFDGIAEDAHANAASIVFGKKHSPVTRPHWS